MDKFNALVTFKDGSYRKYDKIIGVDWGTTENRFLVYNTEAGKIHIKKSEIRTVEEITLT